MFSILGKKIPSLSYSLFDIPHEGVFFSPSPLTTDRCFLSLFLSFFYPFFLAKLGWWSVSARFVVWFLGHLLSEC